MISRNHIFLIINCFLPLLSPSHGLSLRRNARKIPIFVQGEESTEVMGGSSMDIEEEPPASVKRPIIINLLRAPGGPIPLPTSSSDEQLQNFFQQLYDNPGAMVPLYNLLIRNPSLILPINQLYVQDPETLRPIIKLWETNRQVLEPLVLAMGLPLQILDSPVVHSIHTDPNVLINFLNLVQSGPQVLLPLFNALANKPEALQPMYQLFGQNPAAVRPSIEVLLNNRDAIQPILNELNIPPPGGSDALEGPPIPGLFNLLQPTGSELINSLFPNLLLQIILGGLQPQGGPILPVPQIPPGLWGVDPFAVFNMGHGHSHGHHHTGGIPPQLLIPILLG